MKKEIKIFAGIFIVFLLAALNIKQTNAQVMSTTTYECVCSGFNEVSGLCDNYTVGDTSGCIEGNTGTVSQCINNAVCYGDAENPDCKAHCIQDTSTTDTSGNRYGQFCDPNSDNPCGNDADQNSIKCGFDLKSNNYKCIQENSKVDGQECISDAECVQGYCYLLNNVCAGGDSVPTCAGEYGTGFPTALGCFPFSAVQIAAASTALLLGISGAIALILLARASYIYMTSQGDPAKVAEVKESVTAVIFGLIMIIFAIYILSFIGESLLGLIS